MFAIVLAIIALALLLLLFVKVAQRCGWDLAGRYVARHERRLEELQPRQPWD